MEQARVWIGKKGIQRADKKAEREIKVGWVFSYVHHNGRVGSMIVVGCETDFVAKTEDFQKLGRELAAQVAAVMPESREELLESEYFRQPSKKVSELIKEVVGKLGENIQVGEFKVVGV
jgi:elongation factor Ts